MPDLGVLLDKGFAVCVALILLYILFTKLSAIDSTLTKVLTLLSVLVHKTTDFNDVENVLGSHSGKVTSLLDSFESEEAGDAVGRS